MFQRGILCPFFSKKLHNYIEEKDSTSDEQGMFNKWYKKFVDSVTNSTNPNSYLEASKKKICRLDWCNSLLVDSLVFAPELPLSKGREEGTLAIEGLCLHLVQT